MTWKKSCVHDCPWLSLAQSKDSCDFQSQLVERSAFVQLKVCHSMWCMTLPVFAQSAWECGTVRTMNPPKDEGLSVEGAVRFFLQAIGNYPRSYSGTLMLVLYGVEHESEQTKLKNAWWPFAVYSLLRISWWHRQLPTIPIQFPGPKIEWGTSEGKMTVLRKLCNSNCSIAQFQLWLFEITKRSNQNPEPWHKLGLQALLTTELEPGFAA